LTRFQEALRRSLGTGALVGTLLTVPLIAVSYLGWTLFDFPFPPFDLFDGLTRALPGPLATIAIDSMVAAIGVLHLNTADTAKIAEQSMAIASVWAGGALGGAVLFAGLTASGEPASLPGAILGIALGGLAVVLEQSLNRLASPGAVVSAVWVFATFLAWGVAFGLICDRLRVNQMPGAPAHDRLTSQIDRRRILGRLGAAAAVTGLGIVWSALFGGRRENVDGDRWSASHPFPNAGARVAPARGTRPEFTPIERHYCIDIDTRRPALNGERWRLKVGGLVDRPLELTLEELRRIEPLHQFVTLSCISNTVGGDLIGTTRWTGVSLQHLLPQLRLASLATHLKVTSADGFSEVVEVAAIMADERLMLAYAWDGVPLPIEHGFPLRLYVPDRYGMKQPKWIQTIDALDHWEAGYWVQRGWDREGRMRSTSVIDSIATGAKRTDAAGRQLIPIGGISHAGARGISKVEVQIDGGEWERANLREPLSETTWVVWRADLPLPASEHTVTVRCYEGDGTPQTGPTHSRRAKISVDGP
jgi:DMSO/TMAO reductase YedYZ molybdopterin-dependent catalytic subunit